MENKEEITIKVTNIKTTIVIVCIIGFIVFLALKADNIKPTKVETASISETSPKLLLSEVPITENIKDTSINTSHEFNLENQTQLLALTQPLLDKYSFLSKVINTSLPFIESTYQAQLGSINHLEQLQNIKYRSDVAEVLSVVQSESTKLLGITNEIKGIQDQIKLGTDILDTVNKKFGLNPITEDFKSFVTKQTGIIDGYILMFNPSNPDNIIDAVKIRATKTNELQEALIRNL